MSDNEGLKPCPFCYSNILRVDTWSDFYGERHAVECVDCEARGTICLTENEAKEKWNTRK